MKSRKKAAKSPARKSRNQGPSSARPSVEEIRLRAYEIFVERGQADGQDLDDWYQAEKELTETIRKRTAD